MKKRFIADLKKGDKIERETFAVKAYKKTISRANKPYVDLELADKTGTLRAKIWSEALDFCDDVKEGDVVSVSGTVDEFNGTLQAIIQNLKQETKYDLSDFLQRSDKGIEAMFAEIQKESQGIKNLHLKSLLKNIFTDPDFSVLYKEAPAGYTVHHAYVGGLMEHTLELVSMVTGVIKDYPLINADLLRCGAILHDIGKVFEYKVSTTISFQTQGKLLGHLFLGTEFVKSKAPADMPKELLDEVLHILLSHHGEPQLGSAVRPMTAEAVAVHVLDYASSKINMAYGAIHKESLTGEFTAYHRQLQTELYRSAYLYQGMEAEPELPL